VPGHFTTLWKLRSTSTPSGQLAREAAEYYYSARAESVKNNLRTGISVFFIPVLMYFDEKDGLPSPEHGRSVCCVSNFVSDVMLSNADMRLENGNKLSLTHVSGSCPHPV
jgi:hypothetical protein